MSVLWYAARAANRAAEAARDAADLIEREQSDEARISIHEARRFLDSAERRLPEEK